MSVRVRLALVAVLGVVLVAGAFAADRMTGSGDAGEEVAGHLGPTPGPDALGYIEEKETHLDRVAAEHPERTAAALVSTERLLRADEINEMVGELRAALVFGVFGGEPEALTVGDAGLGASVEARTGDAGCACLYAFVVEDGSLRWLAELAGHPEVRLVDVPDPPVETLRGWELTPLLPAQ